MNFQLTTRQLFSTLLLLAALGCGVQDQERGNAAAVPIEPNAASADDARNADPSAPSAPAANPFALAEPEASPFDAAPPPTVTPATPGPPATLAAAAAPQQPRANSAADWPRFRGPNGSGTSADTGVPLTWSDTENIAWKTPLAGPGSSSPVTYGDHVYLTCYTGYGLSKESPGEIANLVRHLVCIDRVGGRVLWTKNVKTTGREAGYSGFNVLHGYATSTPAVDDTGVYVHFGTSGAAGFSHDGDPLWQTPLGEGVHDWGSSASPVLSGDLVIVHADIEGGALVALNKSTGKEAWRVRTGNADSWSTPLSIDAGGRRELVFHHSQGNPTATVAAVNPADGSPLWECQVLKDYLCPSPIFHDGLLYVLGYQRGAAIRPGGDGDVTGSHVAWTINKGSEIHTPIFHDGHLYWAHQESGIAYCVDAKTGRIVYEERIGPRPGLIYASGVLAEGRIYYVSREQGTFVVAAKPTFESLAHNVIESDESIFNATPAIVDGRLLIRSDKALYCIGRR